MKTQFIPYLLLLLLTLSGCGRTVMPLEFPVPETLPMPAPEILAMSEADRLQELDKIRAQQDGPFLLGQGDVMAVSVYDEPDLTVSGIPVRPDGQISFPLIGDVEAIGKSVEGIREEITSRLSHFIKDPKVSVIVSQFRSQQYTIAGQVAKPGVFTIETKITLTKALARSGGLSQGQFHASSVELADLSHAFISRQGQMLPIDFVALFKQGDMRYDITIKPDDYIYIPSGLSKEIYILGEVHRADMFAYTQGMPLSKALVVAKGFTRNADTGRVHLIRGSLTAPEVYVVDLNLILTAQMRDVPLRPGDIIYVPPTGLTRWSDTINKIIPGMVLANTGANIANSSLLD